MKHVFKCFTGIIASLCVATSAQTNGIVYIDSYAGVRSDATSAITQAIASLNGNAGTISFGQGMYPVYGTVIVPSNIRIEGQGWNSSVVGMTDVPVFRTQDGAQWVHFENIRVAFASNTGNAFQIEGINSVGLKLSNVMVDAPVGRRFAGVRIWNGVDTSINSTVTGFLTQIQDCLIRQGSIWIKHTDSKITNNYIWSSEDSSLSPNPKLPFAIRGDKANNLYISGNDIVSAPQNGGIVMYSSTELRIEGNFFDGSFASVKTMYPILGNGVMFSTITGNTFWNNYSGAIKLNDAHHSTIANNVFTQNNRRNLANDHDIAITNNAFPGNGIIITGNNFFKDTLWVNGARRTRTNTMAVNVNGTYPARVQVNGNAAHSMLGGYTSPYFNVPRDSSSIKNNRAQQFLNTVQGQATVSTATGGTVQVTFATPMPYAPKPGEINLQFVGSLANSGAVLSVWDINTNGFKVTVRPIPNYVTNGTIYWKAEYQ